MKKKTEIISRIAKNLRYFYPEYTDHFMCPTCLEVIGLNELSRISEAHIVPKAAGGSLKTYLCRSCNSRFGSIQDKWAGEYIRLKDNKLTPMHTNMQKGYFEVDGVRLSGECRVGPNNSLEFYVWKNKSPPESIEKFLSRTSGSQGGGVKSITIPMPLLQYKAETDVGFLTAAYLLWFKELGYSWVLQNHLNEIRKQMQYPSSKTLQYRYLGLIPGKILFETVDWNFAGK